MNDPRGEQRKRNIARNEALFREVNERVEEVSEGSALEEIDFLCECGDTECTESIAIARSEYEQVRSDPLRFAVAPGHQINGVEDVVEQNDRYYVVRKHEDTAGDIARETDPRS